MSNRLRHRGPDDEGIWFDGDVGVYLGHRRLAVIDLSCNGAQPMVSSDGRFALTFNGEIYNFRSLRAALEGDAEKASWRGHSDTEVMLAAIARWGVHGALERANGMFGLALWDRVSRTLFLARDRLGEKPLYYGWQGSCFTFASELKALREHPEWRGEIDRTAVGLFMRYGYVPAPHSIFAGISKLGPGRVLALRFDGTVGRPKETVSTYWKVPTAAAHPARSDADVIDELEALLRDSVALRMEADVPLGAFLSGGVDSSTIVALMQAQSARPIRTFTIGFEDSGYDEAHHARQVARHLGTEHHELYVTPEMSMAVVPRLPTLYDEPFADPSQIPTVLVSELARQSVTVALSGDGGDELFAGYDRYLWARRVHRRLRWLPSGARRVAARGIRFLSIDAWDAIARSSVIGGGSPAVRDPGQKMHRLADMLDAPSTMAMYDALLSHWPSGARIVEQDQHGAQARGSGRFAGDDADLLDAMMRRDLTGYLPDDILVKVDRATMSVGLEARVPFLDPRVVEFAQRVPLSMKLRNGQTKWLLRQVLDRHVPREMIERPKMGFSVPIGSWIRGPLRDWAEVLLDRETIANAGFFDPGAVRDCWNEHLAGRRNWEYRLWGLLMFQAWLATQNEPAVV